MHAPHPSQVRSSCERCRRQKLRCARHDGSHAGDPCARCQRLGFACEAGPQRKVGRPGRSQTPKVPPVRGRQDSAATPVIASGSAPEISEPPAMIAAAPPPFAADVADVDSPRELFSTRSGGSDETLDVPALNDPPMLDLPADSMSITWDDGLLPADFFTDNASNLLITDLTHQTHLSPLQPAVQHVVHPRPPSRSSPVCLCPEKNSLPAVGASHALAPPADDFAVLSQLNTSLRALLSGVRSLAPRDASDARRSHTCGQIEWEGLPALDVFQSSMPLTTRLLSVLRNIHRRSWPQCSPSPPQTSYSSSSSSPSQIHVCLHASHAPHVRHAAHYASSPLLDRPTALLIISCYTQLLFFFEHLVRLFAAFFRLAKGLPLHASPLEFAGVPMTDLSAHTLMYAAWVRTSMRQIHAVLGIPELPGGASSPWKGLLSRGRDMEMLRLELGTGIVAERPRGMLADLRDLGEEIEECAMASLY